jgi:hypothetical protein
MHVYINIHTYIYNIYIYIICIFPSRLSFPHHEQIRKPGKWMGVSANPRRLPFQTHKGKLFVFSGLTNQPYTPILVAWITWIPRQVDSNIESRDCQKSNTILTVNVDPGLINPWAV